MAKKKRARGKLSFDDLGRIVIEHEGLTKEGLRKSKEKYKKNQKGPSYLIVGVGPLPVGDWGTRVCPPPPPPPPPLGAVCLCDTRLVRKVELITDPPRRRKKAGRKA